MTFLTITYKHNGLEETKALTELVEQKFDVFTKFIPENADTKCEVEFEKVGGHLQGRIYRVEANLAVDGRFYRAEATEENYEKAIDVVKDELDQELRRAKDKHDTLEKDAGREMKEKLLAE